MNKSISFLIFILCLNFNCWGNGSNAPYKLDKITHIQNSQLFSVLDGRNEWVYDFDGKNPCALIQVKFINMPKDEIRALDYICDLNGNKARATVDKLDSEDHSMWIFVTATKKGAFEIIDKNGVKSNRLTGLTFQPKQCYEVTLTCEKRQTINIRALPSNAIFKLDGDKVSTGRFENVTYGSHNLEISINGELKKVTQIEVSDLNNAFEFDLREKKKIKIKSDPRGASIKIDGKLLNKFTPTEVELAYGNYHIEAEMGLNETDAKTITVNEFTEEVVLNPIKRKAFEVSAMFQGRVVPADLYVNGEIYKDKNGNIQTGLLRYTFNEPVGTKLKLRMSYVEATEERTIKVEQGMDENQQFHIKPRNRITWWWQKEYDSDAGGFSFAYVQKQLVTQGNGEKLEENGIWDDGEGKWLSGMQMGLHFQPAFSWGLGLYTGLFYELYMSFNDNYDYNMYTEHDLYLPIHAYYRVPFGEKVALKIHGGFGLSYAFAGTFSQTDSSYGYEDYTDVLGTDLYPSPLNMSIDVGLGLRIYGIQFNAGYSKGFNNHGSYNCVGSGYKTTQNKMTLGLSIAI